MTMEKIGEDENREYFRDYFEGNEVRMSKVKANGEVLLNADDMARCYGFKDMNDFLSSDAGLDIINKWKETYPDRPVFGKDGMFT